MIELRDWMVFEVQWVPMMAAMMAPSLAPVGVRYSRVIGTRRVVAQGAFVGAYLTVWAATGAPAWLLRQSITRLPAGVPLAAVDGSALDLALAPATDVPSACAVVVGVLAARGGHQAGAYLERSGRLRCQASAGGGHLLDGIPVAAGPIGLALRSGEEQLVDGLEGIHQAACLPLVVWGDAVGVLVLAGSAGIGAGELTAARHAARALSTRIEQLGGPPDERAASRLAQHIGALAALDDPARVERASLRAAV